MGKGLPRSTSRGTIKELLKGIDMKIDIQDPDSIIAGILGRLEVLENRQVNSSLVNLPFYNVAEWGTVKNDPTRSIDQTAAFQAIVDEVCNVDPVTGLSQGSALLWVPAWSIAMTQIRWYHGFQLWGSGMGGRGHFGTDFYQLDGVNAGLFVSDPTDLPPMDWAHYTEFKNFRLSKENGSPLTAIGAPAEFQYGVDTIGSGIEVNCRVGEQFRVSQVQIFGFPEDGIHFKHGCTTSNIDGVSSFHNGRYGVHIQREGIDTYNSMNIGPLSGDDNGRALVGVTLGGTFHDMVYVHSLKSESHYPGRQPYAVETTDFHGQFMHIENVSMSNNGGDPQALLSINGVNTGRYSIRGFAIDLTPNILIDHTTGQGYANTLLTHELNYYKGCHHRIGF